MGIAEIYGTKGVQLRGKRILICVTGSIAAIEVPHLVREILRYSGDPIVVLSQEARRFVASDALTWCMDKEPITRISGVSEHIKWIAEPANKVDLCLICPATANTIGKLANGIVDGPVTLASLAAFGAKIPILIIPAAHSVLLENPITKRNIDYLKKQNVAFFSSAEAESKFKFPPLSLLMREIFSILTLTKRLKGRKFLVTGGATREYLDDVRFLSNPSTGLSALHIAQALIELGSEVLFILGEGHTLDLTLFPIPTKVIRSTQHMYETIHEELSNNEYDGLISVAAVSDYRPEYQPGKLASRQVDLQIRLIPTIKILEKIRENFPGLFIVAYKAEVGVTKEELLKRGREFLKKHQLEIVCANWVGEPEKGFISKTNELFVIKANDSTIHLQGSKEMLGKHLANIITETIDNRRDNQ